MDSTTGRTLPGLYIVLYFLSLTQRSFFHIHFLVQYCFLFKSFFTFFLQNKTCPYAGGSSRVSACSKRQCGCKEFSIFMLMACWWLGGPPRKLSWGLVAAAMAANRGGAPPPPNRAKEGGRRGRADNRSFSISASCKRFAFARRF